MKRNKLTQKRLKELLHYDPETGIFTWRKYRSYNAPTGSVAGTHNSNGYIVICIDRSREFAHRLVWLYMHGYIPECTIDHINRDRLDNRLENLREATRQCNARNIGLQQNNTSGIKGVTWDKSRIKWVAFIKVSGKHIPLGRYADKSDAAMRRWEAEKEHGFPGCCCDSTAYRYLIENKIISE